MSREQMQTRIAAVIYKTQDTVLWFGKNSGNQAKPIAFISHSSCRSSYSMPHARYPSEQKNRYCFRNAHQMSDITVAIG